MGNAEESGSWRLGSEREVRLGWVASHASISWMLSLPEGEGEDESEVRRKVRLVRRKEV